MESMNDLESILSTMNLVQEDHRNTPSQNISNSNRRGLKVESDEDSAATTEVHVLPDWSTILENLLKSQRRCDFILIVGQNKERIPVHRTILEIRSESLCQEISKLSRFVNELVMPNVTVTTVQHALNYLYHENLKRGITLEDLLSLLDFEYMYKTHSLRQRIISLLKRRISVRNVIRIYKKAVEYEIRNLEEISFKFILRNAKEFFCTNDFLTLNVHELNNFLKNDDLNVHEVDVFQGVIRWGCSFFQNNVGSLAPPTKEELRAVLNTTKNYIRFPLLSAQDVGLFVAPSGLLSSDELVSIYNYVSVSDKLNCPIAFNTRKRNLQLNGANNPDFATHNLPSFHNNASMEHPTSSNATHETAQNNRPREDVLRISSDPLQTPLSEMPRTEFMEISTTADRSSKKLVEDVFDICQGQKIHKLNSSFNFWNEYVAELGSTPNLNSTVSYKLENVELLVGNPFPSFYIPNLREVYLDLIVRDIKGLNASKQVRRRFERLFDVRQFLCFRTDTTKDGWKLNELWDLSFKIPITIRINGVTYLHIDKLKKELTIAFRNDYEEILSGLGKNDHLSKLCLLKTDVPHRFEGFPAKFLTHVVFYHLWTYTENDVATFIRRCPNLTKFASWVISSFWETTGCRNNTSGPIELNLLKDFVSGDKLEHLALCKVVLTLPLLPKLPIKVGLKVLVLCDCFWPDCFDDNFKLLFPNLEKVFLKQKTFENTKHNYKAAVTVRMIKNILSLPKIQTVRIWGLNWDERYEDDTNGKLLRSRLQPITDDEFEFVQIFLSNCNLPDYVYNFLLERNGEVWKGTEYNENEAKDDDHGFWDQMDCFDFENYTLDNFFKDYKVMQTEFDISLELP